MDFRIEVESQSRPVAEGAALDQSRALEVRKGGRV